MRLPPRWRKGNNSSVSGIFVFLEQCKACHALHDFVSPFIATILPPVANLSNRRFLYFHFFVCIQRAQQADLTHCT